MTEIFNALFPIFLLIAFGYLLRRSGFPGDAFWPLASRLIYYILFPALLTNTLALAELQNLEVAPLAISVTGAMFGVAILALLGKPFFRVADRAFTSLFQGSIRHNTFVGLAAAAGLYGNLGLAIASIPLAVLTPLVNVLSVTVLSVYGPADRVEWVRVGQSIIKNPLIQACVVGIVLNWTGVGLPFGSDQVLGLLGRASLPLGLLVVGADLNIRLIPAGINSILLSSLFKLLLYPLLTAMLCYQVGVTGQARAVAVLFTALPSAPSAYVLALEMDGDEKLMAAILSGQTVLAMVTMSLMLNWLG